MTLVSSLSRRLILAESDKADADRTVGTIRLRNEELRKNYEQVILENDHRMHVDDHVREMTEMKRLLGSIGPVHRVARSFYGIFQMN